MEVDPEKEDKVINVIVEEDSESYEDSDEDEAFDLDDTEEGRITGTQGHHCCSHPVNASSPLQPKKGINEAGYNKLNLTYE
jgi:hypothetical protein